MIHQDLRARLMTAYHEGGHVVAFLRLGLRFEAVSVDAGGLAGEVACASWDEIAPDVRAIISHAGPLAETQYVLSHHAGPGPLYPGEARQIEHHAYTSGGHVDLVLVEDALRSLGRAADADLRSRARDLVHVNWRAVGRIATALAEHGGLEYADVVSLGDLR